jgi:hypothetical protein
MAVRSFMSYHVTARLAAISIQSSCMYACLRNLEDFTLKKSLKTLRNAIFSSHLILFPVFQMDSRVPSSNIYISFNPCVHVYTHQEVITSSNFLYNNWSTIHKRKGKKRREALPCEVIDSKQALFIDW